VAHDTAGKQGQTLEERVEGFLNADGFISIKSVATKAQFKSIRKALTWQEAAEICQRIAEGKPFYCNQFGAFDNIYCVRWNIDFFVWHPEIFSKYLAIEAKQQSVAGSVDEKYPFVVHSLKAIAEQTEGLTAVFVSGDAIRRCVADWCKKEETDSFKFLESDREFRHFIKTGRMPGRSTERNTLPKPQTGLF